MGYSPARQFGVRMKRSPNLLISLGFEICMNSVQAREALDFQGLRGLPMWVVNKVIHRNSA